MTVDMLHSSLNELGAMIVNQGGDVIGLIGDNHPTNRKCMSLFATNVDKPWIGSGIDAEATFTLLTDPVHLMKSIRNNWVSEKNQTIRISFGHKVISANWRHLVAIYEKEKDNVVRRTPLTHQSLFPNNIEKQKFSLVAKIFNERTIAALKTDGYDVIF